MDREAWRLLLPARVIYDVDDMTCELSFAALSSPATTLGDIFEPKGAERAASWIAHTVIGTEYFSNGSALFCVRMPTADVVRFDIELDQPESFVNASVEQLARSLGAAVRWTVAQGTKPSNASLDELTAALVQLDSAAFASPRNFWPLLIGYAREAMPGTLSFRELPALRL